MTSLVTLLPFQSLRNQLYPTLCAYGDKCSKGNWNFQKIEKDILLKDRRFIKNAAGKLQKALYSDMTVNASVVFKFLVHNVVPKSHTSDTTMKIVPLIWSIIKEMEVDIARLISNEMKSVTLNCATCAKSSLTFPGLIMGLLRAKGLKIPTPADEEIQYPIDDTFISSLVKRRRERPITRGRLMMKKLQVLAGLTSLVSSLSWTSSSGIIGMFGTRTPTSCTIMRPLTEATWGFIRLCIMLTCIQEIPPTRS